VCANPFPSRPLGFVGDDDGARFHAAYFARNPGVWTHGDLIEFSPQGGARLHGRSDGLLNVRGVKFAPMEIYRALHAVEEVREAMVVEQRAHRANGDQGGSVDQRIVALLVLREDAVLDAQLAARMRHQIATHSSPAHVPDALIAVAQLPVTYSGKPSEAAARAAVNGEPVANADALRNPGCLDAIRRQAALARGDEFDAPDPAGQPLATQLRRLFQRHLGLAEVSTEDSFFELGGKSLAAVRLLADVQRLTGRALPLGALMHAPSVAEFAAVIEGRAGVPSSSVLVPMRRGSGRPLFIVHSQSCTIVEMWPVVAAMRSTRPIWGLQARGIDGEQPPHERVEEFAASYIEQIRTIQPRGPYALCGFSFGGSVAFEMASQLAQSGETIEMLCLLDPYLSHPLSWKTAAWQIWARVASRLERLRPREVPALVANYLGRGVDEVAIRLGLKPRRRPSHGRELSAARARVYDAVAAAHEMYRPQPYEAGPVAFIRADILQGGHFDPMPVWRRVARRGLDVIDVPGTHMDVIGSNVELVALHIDTLLAWSCREASRSPSTLATRGPWSLHETFHSKS
jgi:acetoacetyl-CoA synthetase